MLMIWSRKDHSATISDVESKYFTTSDYNKIKSEILETKLQ